MVDRGNDFGKGGVVEDDARGVKAALAGKALDLGREGYEILEIGVAADDPLECGVVLVIPSEVMARVSPGGEEADLAWLVTVDLAHVR